MPTRGMQISMKRRPHEAESFLILGRPSDEQNLQTVQQAKLVKMERTLGLLGLSVITFTCFRPINVP